MPRCIPLLLILLIPIYSFSQNLVLANGNAKKTIKVGKFIEIGLDANTDEDCKCDGRFLYGQYEGVENGQIKMIVYQERYVKTDVDSRIWNTTDFRNELQVSKLIPEDGIVSIAKKPKPRKNSVNAVGVVGGLLVAGGLMTSVNGLSLNDDDSRESMILLGLAEFGVGVVISIAANKTLIFYLQPTKQFPNIDLYRIL